MLGKFRLIKNNFKIKIVRNRCYTEPLLTNPDIIIAEQGIKKLVKKKGCR